MSNDTHFDVIIIGGSYAGLSAAMALGRSLRHILIIDSGQPCNQQTPHSHNFITQDGETPAAIAQKAKDQVLSYPGVMLLHDKVQQAERQVDHFSVVTASNVPYTADKLLFATGIRDQLLPIEGFAECWGISVLHCPYCHGYEVSGQTLGVLANGDMGFEFAKLIQHWSPKLTLFTNGPSTLTEQQFQKLQTAHIEIIEKPIHSLQHTEGRLEKIQFNDGSTEDVSALFARVPFEQHCLIPQELGCELTESGHIKVDELAHTTVEGVYAAGDNTSFMRAVSAAVAAGTKAGASINKDLIEERFGVATLV